MTNTITQEQIDALFAEATIETQTIFDKCTLVSVQFANGFILSETSACVDAENYDEAMGAAICLGRIENKLWELEGYRLQCAIAE